MKKPIIHFRPYQFDAFSARDIGTEIWCWGRQTGKSFTLAAWAVDRLLSRPGRLVTVLSNSRDNGAELNMKVGEICHLMGAAFESEDLSPDSRYENMRMETRITVRGKTGRIKVLAASPRTARGFSGDLVLDEFAFHEDSQAIWEAAEPILSSNPDFMCRIASTLNGRRNMFYRLLTSGTFPVRSVRRSDAWKQGLKISHPVTREPITPDQARALAIDKTAYDQNYENVAADENMALLTFELIGLAEDDRAGVICDGDWSVAALDLMRAAVGHLYVGIDVGRNRDLTVISVVEQLGHLHMVRGLLRLDNMRLPQQQARLAPVCAMPKFRRAAIDMTGLGLGLCEYAQDEFGQYRIQGVNFGSTVPTTRLLLAEGRKAPTVRVTEAMATQLLQVYESKAIRHPIDVQLRDDLRKPERIVTPGGRVSIAAVRDEAGHADHFWSLALAIEAAYVPSLDYSGVLI